MLSLATFSRLLAVAEEKMSSHGILETFDDVEVPGLFPQADGHPLIQHTMLGPTWMDDLCISITSDTALDLEHKVGLAAGILLQTCMNHGVAPNLQRGKSEILLTFRGQGSRALKQKYLDHNKDSAFRSSPSTACTPFQWSESTSIWETWHITQAPQGGK